MPPFLVRILQKKMFVNRNWRGGCPLADFAMIAGNQKTILFLMFIIMCGAGSFMIFSIMEAGKQADMQHQVVAACVEGYTARILKSGSRVARNMAFIKGFF